MSIWSNQLMILMLLKPVVYLFFRIELSFLHGHITSINFGKMVIFWLEFCLQTGHIMVIIFDKIVINQLYMHWTSRISWSNHFGVEERQEDRLRRSFISTTQTRYESIVLIFSSNM